MTKEGALIERTHIEKKIPSVVSLKIRVEVLFFAGALEGARV